MYLCWEHLQPSGFQPVYWQPSPFSLSINSTSNWNERVVQVIQDRVTSSQKVHFPVTETSSFTHLLISILSWLILFIWITYHLSKDTVYVKFARYNLKISHHLLFVITDQKEPCIWVCLWSISIPNSTCSSGSLLIAIRCKGKENICTTIMLLFCIPQHYLKIYCIIIILNITTHHIKTLK